MSSTPFGEHLKREREMRGVSLEEIAAATRISTRFLEAIEGEHWEQLPGGVFNRGFIRSIARYLGMDEDSLVAEYDLGAKNNGHSHTAPAIPAERVPRNWKPAAVAIIVVIALAVAIGFGFTRYRSKIASGLHRGLAVATARVHHVYENAPTAKSGDGPANSARRSGSASASANSPGAAAAPLQLKMEVGKAATVKVVADGNVVFQGPVRVNDVKQFQARNTFQISSSESSALLLELNGQTVPPIGTPGQPGSITLTRSDLKTPSGDSH